MNTIIIILQNNGGETVDNSNYVFRVMDGLRLLSGGQFKSYAKKGDWRNLLRELIYSTANGECENSCTQYVDKFDNINKEEDSFE